MCVCTSTVSRSVSPRRIFAFYPPCMRSLKVCRNKKRYICRCCSRKIIQNLLMRVNQGRQKEKTENKRENKQTHHNRVERKKCLLKGLKNMWRTCGEITGIVFCSSFGRIILMFWRFVAVCRGDAPIEGLRHGCQTWVGILHPPTRPPPLRNTGRRKLDHHTVRVCAQRSYLRISIAVTQENYFLWLRDTHYSARVSASTL